MKRYYFQNHLHHRYWEKSEHSQDLVHDPSSSSFLVLDDLLTRCEDTCRKYDPSPTQNSIKMGIASFLLKYATFKADFCFGVMLLLYKFTSTTIVFCPLYIQCKNLTEDNHSSQLNDEEYTSHFFPFISAIARSALSCL